MSANKRRMLGPFSVAADDVKPAGFWCKLCHRPVEVARQSLPSLAPRACLFGCDCEIGVVTWEDETQPDRQSWHRVMKHARKGNVALIIFNENRPTSSEFQGPN